MPGLPNRFDLANQKAFVPVTVQHDQKIEVGSRRGVLNLVDPDDRYALQ